MGDEQREVYAREMRKLTALKVNEERERYEAAVLSTIKYMAGRGLRTAYCKIPEDFWYYISDMLKIRGFSVSIDTLVNISDCNIGIGESLLIKIKW